MAGFEVILYGRFWVITEDNQFVDDFEYRSWSGGDNFAFSRASLFYDHQVLKMGGVRIPRGKLDGRNLDFVDLDGLVVTGNGPTLVSKIAYSSCRRIVVQDAEVAFLTFTRCNLEDLKIDNCRIQDFYFQQCRVGRPSFSRSRLFRVGVLEESSIYGINVDDCELLEFRIDRLSRLMSYKDQADLFRRMRVAFQQKGDRSEASQYYYRERSAELLSGFVPFVPVDFRLPQPAYPGSYRELLDRLQAGQFTRKQVGQFVVGNVVAKLKLLSPRCLFRMLVEKIQTIGRLLDWAIWGFGERPARVFPWMLIVLSIFSAKYYVAGGRDGSLQGDLLQSIYCSAFNFATVGCDNKTSLDSIEAILGATLLGIMVAGFANRTKY